MGIARSVDGTNKENAFLSAGQAMPGQSVSPVVRFIRDLAAAPAQELPDGNYVVRLFNDNSPALLMNEYRLTVARQ